MGIGKRSVLLNDFGKAVERGIRLDQLGIKTVGVDATIWLVTVHRNLEDNQKKNYSLHAKCFMDYCGERIDVLQRNGLIPTLVFDGNATPLKTEMYVTFLFLLRPHVYVLDPSSWQFISSMQVNNIAERS